MESDPRAVNASSQAPTLIVGAGIAGLTLADLLVRAGRPVVLVEAEARVGGLARSFAYGDAVFDIGPHRFYSAEKRVLEYIQEVVGEDGLWVPMRTAVHLFGRYHRWPLGPSILFSLPPGVQLQLARDLLTRRRDIHHDFRDEVIGKYGPTVFDLVFRDQTEKFFGLPAERIDRAWCRLGVEKTVIDKTLDAGSLSRLVVLLLRRTLRPSSGRLEFLYPRPGIHVFADRLADRIRVGGGRIIPNLRPEAIDLDGGRVEGVRIGGQRMAVGHVVWTAPLQPLLRLLGLPGLELSYLDLLIFNVLVGTDGRWPFQWCYYPARDIAFNRVSLPANFSPELCPPGKTSLCAEVTCHPGDPRWHDPRQLAGKIVDDLIRVRFARDRSQFEAVHVEPIPHAYPVYELGYQQRLDRSFADLGRVANLSLAGRTARFWHNNMDESIADAMALAERLLRTPDAVCGPRDGSRAASPKPG